MLLGEYANELIPPAGKKTLKRFRFRKSSTALLHESLEAIALNEVTYMPLCSRI
jgi:hypothetical protein